MTTNLNLESDFYLQILCMQLSLFSEYIFVTLILIPYDKNCHTSAYLAGNSAFSIP